jgi:hypothetical protein
VLMYESLPLERARELVREDSTAVTDGAEENKLAAGDHSLAVERAEVTSKKAYTAFDDLDMRSAFFEQYLIQDAHNGVTTTDVLGGEEAVRTFQQLLTQHGFLMVNTVLSRTDHWADIDADPPLLKGFEHGANTIHISLKSPSEQGELLSERMVADSSFRDADLLWIDVRNGSSEQDSSWSEFIAGEIAKLRHYFFGDLAEHPILIVSSMRGLSRTVAPPFISGCEESLIHVPLWIDDGKGHARRIQKLAGSFDLLPTLADYLKGEPVNESSRVPTGAPVSGDKDAESKDTATLAVGPQSLRPMLRDFDCESDRLLRLVGDSWSALRSQQYLLITAEMQDQNAATMDLGLDRRRLYLKPDDVWNVHDSIVTYEAVADEMDAVWQQNGG